MKALMSFKPISRCLGLILCLVLMLSSCSFIKNNEETTVPEAEPETAVMPEGVITVPFTSNDSLNPFKCDSLLNSSLVSLVFRSLYRLDGGFEAQRDMSINETVNGKKVKVEIDDSFVFSDAHSVTADDIIYSFELAKDSPLYGEALSNIKSCEREGNFSVVFELESPDINVLNLLTFPIAENGTADSEDGFPVGSGYYKYTAKDMRTVLVCNMRYAGNLPKIGTIRLYDMTESSSLMHLLDTGVIDCFFTDLSDGTAKRTYSSVNEVYLNNLIFLGLNLKSYRLTFADVRKGISMAIDRRAISENSFLSHARLTGVPFNISWSQITNSQLSDLSAAEFDLNSADALLYNAACGTKGDKVYLTLICRDSNSFIKNTAELIADQLKEVNITVTLKVLSDTEFETALTEGDYDMYMSEIKLTKNMDLSAFFTPGKSASFGIDNDAVSIDESYFDYKEGKIGLDEFITAFNDSMPFIPLLFRNGQFCYSRRITGVTGVTENSLFSSISNWEISE